MADGKAQTWRQLTRAMDAAPYLPDEVQTFAAFMRQDTNAHIQLTIGSPEGGDQGTLMGEWMASGYVAYSSIVLDCCVIIRKLIQPQGWLGRKRPVYEAWASSLNDEAFYLVDTKGTLKEALESSVNIAVVRCVDVMTGR